MYYLCVPYPAVVYQHSCSCLFPEPCVFCCSACFTLVPDVHPTPLPRPIDLPYHTHSLNTFYDLLSTTRDRQGKEFLSIVEGMCLLGQVVRRREGKKCTLCTFVALDASAPLCLCKCVSHDILNVTLVRINVFMTSFPYLVVMKFTTL